MKTLVFLCLIGLAVCAPIDDTEDVMAAKAEFMKAFEMNEKGEHANLAPMPVGESFLEDTADVKAMKAMMDANFKAVEMRDNMMMPMMVMPAMSTMQMMPAMSTMQMMPAMSTMQMMPAMSTMKMMPAMSTMKMMPAMTEMKVMTTMPEMKTMSVMPTVMSSPLMTTSMMINPAMTMPASFVPYVALEPEIAVKPAELPEETAAEEHNEEPESTEAPTEKSA